MDQQKIGAFLRELRKEKGLTQEQLAERLNVAGRTVSRWETGSNMPDISILIELADYYEIDIREILNGERKSESMEQELKETLENVAAYTEKYTGAEKKKLLMRVLLMNGAIAAVLTVVGAALWYGSALRAQEAFYELLMLLLVISTAGAGLMLLRLVLAKTRFRRAGVWICASVIAAVIGASCLGYAAVRDGDASSAVIHIGASDLYTEEELCECRDLILEKFREYRGFSLISLNYDEVFSLHEQDTGTVVTNVPKTPEVIFTSDFEKRTIFFTGGAFSMRHTDFKWYLERGGDGKWKVNGWGYA